MGQVRVSSCFLPSLCPSLDNRKNISYNGSVLRDGKELIQMILKKLLTSTVPTPSGV